MKIADIVNRKGRHVECVRESWPLEQAIRTMHRKAIGSVVVLDSHGNEVVGIVSQSEIVAAMAQRGGHALKLPVLIFMRQPALFCHCEDDAASVLQLMSLERCRHIVVCTSSSDVAGVVSQGDLVAALLEQSQLEAGVLRDLARSQLLARPG